MGRNFIQSFCLLRKSQRIPFHVVKQINNKIARFHIPFFFYSIILFQQNDATGFLLVIHFLNLALKFHFTKETKNEKKKSKKNWKNTRDLYCIQHNNVMSL